MSENLIEVKKLVTQFSGKNRDSGRRSILSCKERRNTWNRG